MSDDLSKTVRLVRRGKVTTDDRGRSVWAEPVADAELELVSTQMLEQMLESDDEERKERLKTASSARDGVLARNTSTEDFEVIDDDDLKAALSVAEDSSGPGRVADVVYEPVVDEAGQDEAEELSLVSTQMLRQMLGADEEPDEAETNPEDDAGHSFDPYNSG